MQKLTLTIIAIFMALSLVANNQDNEPDKGIANADAMSIEITRSPDELFLFASDEFMAYNANIKEALHDQYNKMTTRDADYCLLGEQDAELYHGKQGRFFTLGIFFGPFALLGSALTNPVPEKGAYTMEKSINKEHIHNPDYRKCYRGKAKRNHAKYAAMGWGSWLLLSLLISNAIAN